MNIRTFSHENFDVMCLKNNLNDDTVEINKIKHILNRILNILTDILDQIIMF